MRQEQLCKQPDNLSIMGLVESTESDGKVAAKSSSDAAVAVPSPEPSSDGTWCQQKLLSDNKHDDDNTATATTTTPKTSLQTQKVSPEENGESTETTDETNHKNNNLQESSSVDALAAASNSNQQTPMAKTKDNPVAFLHDDACAKVSNDNDASTRKATNDSSSSSSSIGVSLTTRSDEKQSNNKVFKDDDDDDDRMPIDSSNEKKEKPVKKPVNNKNTAKEDIGMPQQLCSTRVADVNASTTNEGSPTTSTCIPSATNQVVEKKEATDTSVDTTCSVIQTGDENAKRDSTSIPATKEAPTLPSSSCNSTQENSKLKKEDDSNDTTPSSCPETLSLDAVKNTLETAKNGTVSMLTAASCDNKTSDAKSINNSSFTKKKSEQEVSYSDNNGTPSEPSNGNKTEYHSVQPSSSTDDIEMKDATVGAEKTPQGTSSTLIIKEVPPVKNENDKTTTSSPPFNSSDTAADAGMKDTDAKMDVERKDFNADAKDEPEPTKEEAAEEEEEPTSSLTELWEELSEIDTPGSTCAAGPASCLPAIPGLHVEGVGDIPLPICDAQVKMLASVAEQAPHGKGMETIVDTAVRNTLQVDPSKVTMKNPAWKASLNKVVQLAAEALGVSPNLVNAELYKLLLYEEGGFFKKHRDTEKAKGMFATLVIQLPSIFTGGSFVVSHGGESEIFTMGAGTTAAYGCHFVCHYADCEHEIKKVESGNRLALIYSLCYAGPCMPTASDYGHIHLTSVLGRLPADESLFVIPLVHQYTTSSLARLGVSALKGSDRAKQSAIENAGKGKWKMIVAKADRTDYESGDGSYYGGFDVYDVERGNVTLSDAYHADGSDAGDHLPWIRKQLNYESVEEGGMMLVSAEDLEDDGAAVWGDGDSGSVEYTGNEGATRETTYSMYVMVVYSEETGFERMCSSEFSSAVAHVDKEKSIDLMRCMLAYMKTKKPSISNENCIRLLGMISEIGLSEEESLLAFGIIVGALSNEIPSAALTDSLLVSAERFGWVHAVDLFKGYATRLCSCKNLNVADFLKKMDFLLRMQRACGSNDFDLLVDQSTKDFDIYTNSQGTTNIYGYSYGYRSNFTSMQVAADALVSLSQRHPREKSNAIVDACLAHMKKHEGTAPEKLAQRSNLIQRLRPFHDASSVEVWFHTVVEEFISIVEKPPTSRYASTDALSSNHAEELVRLLFEFGMTNDVRRIQQWATNAQLAQLTKLEKIVDKVAASISASALKCRDPTAVVALSRVIKSRAKTLKLSDLRIRHQKLLAVTQRGEPVFSWMMPHASTSNAALNAFLRSTRKGPETIVVGGGISNARTLAGSGRYSYSYSRFNSRTIDPIGQGYSATIVATNATGRNASIRVEKTRALHDALVQKYRKDLAELNKIAAEIRDLGGTVATLPTVATSEPRSVVNGSASANPRPAKKPRVKAPIPSNAEIVEID